MKNEFKVGDRVRIREWDDMVKEFAHSVSCIYCSGSFVDGMKPLCGRTATITDIDGRYVFLQFDDKFGDIGWTYTTDMIEHLTPQEITVNRYGNKVVAKWGKRVGVAKCNPEDNFDFATGALLAVERLFKREGATQRIIDATIDRVRDELYEINGIKKNK